MYILIKHNSNYNDIIKDIDKKLFSPITLFQITINEKTKIKQSLEKIKETIQSNKIEKTAIQVFLEKIDNSTIGIINNLKNDFDIIIGYGGTNKINRFFIEQTQIDLLQDPHNSKYYNKIDYIHHFNSGLNHVLCNLAKNKQIGILISLNFAKEESKKNIPKEIGRINQNIKFTNKYNLNLYINYLIEDKKQILKFNELKKITSLFDISNQQIQNIPKTLENIIIKKKQKQDKNYIQENIQLIK
ncbi:MAG: hypothetical protein ACOC16_01910 [Nanoarchaeota archaeon]